MDCLNKICGVTIPEQAREISALGADYIGCIIEFPKSTRSVSAETAREIQEAVGNGMGAINHAHTVGVVVDLPIARVRELIKETGIRIWQLHGNEDNEYVMKMKEMGVEVWKVYNKVATGRDLSLQLADTIVVDAKNSVHGAGGSGKLSDWDLAKQLIGEGYDVILSGGLNPENVQDGIKLVRPRVVDTSSGVETSPGIKDLVRVKKFITNAKRV